MHKIMYRIIYLILTSAIVSCTNSDNEFFYLNDDFDIIYMNDTSVTFYSKSCINPYEIFQSNGKFYINSRAYYCSDEMKVLDYKINLKIKETIDDIIIESDDSCFINFFRKSKSKFVKMDKLDFDFEWDKIKIRNYDNFDVDTSQIISRNKIPEIQLAKLWIISNPGYKLKTECTDCFYTTFIFYYKDEIVLKKTTSILPCWYNIIE